MSSANYNLKNKGVRLIPMQTAWVKGKNGKRKLNPNYRFVGKVDIGMPNVVISATENKKPVYKGDVGDLNNPAKKQLVDNFFGTDGKRNRRRIAYLGIKK